MPPLQCCELLAKSEVFKKQSATSAEQSKDRACQESNGVCHARVLSHFGGGLQRCILLKSQTDRILARHRTKTENMALAVYTPQLHKFDYFNQDKLFRRDDKSI